MKGISDEEKAGEEQRPFSCVEMLYDGACNDPTRSGRAPANDTEQSMVLKNSVTPATTH